MNPDQYTQGGLLDNVDVRVVDARFERFDYNGTANEVPALCLMMVPLDGSGSETAQHWPCGDLKDFVPGETGEFLELAREDGPSGIRLNTNLAALNKELILHGWPKDKFDSGSAKAYIGLEVHVVRKTVKNDMAKEGEKKERQILLPSKIIKYPWENKARNTTTRNTAPAAGSSTPAAASAAATPATAATIDWENSPHKQIVGDAITKLLAGSKSMPRIDIKKALIPALTSVPMAEKKTALLLVDSNPFLDSLSLMVDGDTLTSLV